MAVEGGGWGGGGMGGEFLSSLYVSVRVVRGDVVCAHCVWLLCLPVITPL